MACVCGAYHYSEEQKKEGEEDVYFPARAVSMYQHDLGAACSPEELLKEKTAETQFQEG